jgi:hypothetical protein
MQTTVFSERSETFTWKTEFTTGQLWESATSLFCRRIRIYLSPLDSVPPEMDLAPVIWSTFQAAQSPTLDRYSAFEKRRCSGDRGKRQNWPVHVGCVVIAGQPDESSEPPGLSGKLASYWNHCTSYLARYATPGCPVAKVDHLDGKRPLMNLPDHDSISTQPETTGENSAGRRAGASGCCQNRKE